ncbi:enoyl-CoA hydratase-related protein [Sandaracinobacteroides saxicola]|uniref:Enoyl-CoA hydratase/isomerase family protein n=1 Tax=Sandaracinobacteroides saxicola TaxID=2759707 RepID=A0A7G5IL79_9SPHN|nr:enoyl-CoA hydratase-related protein [Sandaracinobacteroides saxicola]QMW24121.1 enoyl-CoA hydratase/isomerase family protein [Sandaracinobacteroides saxicola]
MTTQPESVGREVLYDIIDGHIALVRLNRPDKRNAVNGDVAAAMDWIVKQTEADDAIRVAILTSSSPDFFCAGADLSEISKGRGHLLSTPDGGFAGFVTQPREKPWIAGVVGAGLAGGCEIALTCDMIVASDSARFGLPEVKRGLFAGAGGVFRLPRKLPAAIALELIATGDPIDAARAYALGLVNRLVSAEKVQDEAIALAKAIAVNAPLSVRESMKVARLAFEKSEADLWPISRATSAKVFSSEDAREGPVAFLEKRAPVWKGR